MQLSQKVQAMELSPIRKFYVYANAAKAQGKKVYGLNIGQPDIKTPKAFFDAVRNFDEDVLAYAPSEGIPELREAVAGYYKRIGLDFTPDEILITDGGSEAITMIMTAILDSGDEVIMAEPFYTNYRTFVGQAGGSIVPIPTTAEDGYRYADRAKIEGCLSPRSRAICVVNPGNPTGRVLTREEIRMICDIAVKNDLYIVADEVYREFVYDGLEMTSFGEVKEAAQNVIIVDSVSKRFSACGARIGSIASKNKALMQNILKLCQARLCCPTIDQVGAAALYNLDPSYFDEIKKEYEYRRNVSYAALKEIDGLVCEKPQGAFYITCKLPVDDAEDFLVWLLQNFDIDGETCMFAPAAGFYGTPGVGKADIRIAYVLNADDMKAGIEIIKEGIKAYKNR